jgi:hypothetical protein
VTPELSALVPTIVDELGKLCVGHWSTGNLETRYLYRMSPLLVVEHKRQIRRGSESKGGTGYRGVPT